MAIYRAERNLFSMSSEAGAGGYIDYISAITDAGGAATTLTGAHNPGTREITVASTAGYAVLDYVQIGTGSNAEVRRVARVVSATVMDLDYPLGFYHVNAEVVDEKTATSITGSSFLTFLPGVYETVTVPDMVTEITPHWFLGTASNRNPYLFLRGKQSFTGSLPAFILLNGFPLRFPIGRITSVGGTAAGGSSTLSSAIVKGTRNIPMTDGTNFANGDFIEIDRGGTYPEVRQIISGAGGAGAQTFVVNYPIMLDHANGLIVSEVTTSTFYTHTISETVGLDSMSWNLNLRDSDGTVANDFIRRYVGGKVGRATIGATEGGMLTMSFDDVTFLDIVHNQVAHSSMAGTDAMPKSSATLITPAGIGGAIPHSGGVLGTPTYPTTAPYYFSQGSISLFGVTLARIRNFRIDINNNIDPRYYIVNQGQNRIPFENIEQRREYRMSATIALPDSLAATATTRTMFKELLLEGNYDAGFTGFNISLVFTRGTNDTITITIPSSAAATGGDAQGAFIVRGPTNPGTESPVQADLDIIFRNLSIVCVDAVPTYP